MSHSCKIHRSHRMRGMHSRCRLAFSFFRGRPMSKGWIHTFAASIIDDYASVERDDGVWVLTHLLRSLPRIFLLRKWRLWSHGVPACMQTSIRASGGCPVVCLPMTSGLGCQLPGSQQFRSTAPRFFRFRCDCPRNDLSMVLDSIQLSLFINWLLSAH